MTWQPTATLRALKTRADVHEKIRHFFSGRNILEVETPLLGMHTVTNPAIQTLATTEGFFLQTGPDYFMKRLFAATTTDIYQLCKAFHQCRNDKLNNIETSLLEWLRKDFDQWDMMDEVADLLEHLLGTHHFEHLSYRDAFINYLGINPWEAEIDALKFEAQQHLNIEIPRATKDDWLHLLMSHFIEPHLGQNAPVFIYDFPPTQAGLAKTTSDESGFAVAEKFQLFYKGTSLAQGCHELNDATQIKHRFHEENQRRMAMGLQIKPIDYSLLNAFENNPPAYASVILELDKVLMALLKTDNLDDVLSFRGINLTSQPNGKMM